MVSLADYTSYADAQAHYRPEALWDLFDGDASHFNIAHECIDRHAGDPDRVAIRVAHPDGDEVLRFAELAAWSARFAHWLADQGVAPGDRVAFMLEPSRAYYVGLFGAIKHGAIGVPLFTLFGPEALRLRVEDCKPALLVTNEEKAPICKDVPGLRVVVADDALFDRLSGYPDRFEARSAANDLAIFQYTSGTTRELPEAVRHTHRAVVTLMSAALYGTGIRPGDRFFCPSSPAWGHGLWHGTLAPLALGVETGTMAGKFEAGRLLRGLSDYRITNMSAAATHYRMIRLSGAADRHQYSIEKLSYTGEPIDPATLDFVETTFRVPVCSMYGTTEVGVVLVNYPGAADFPVKPGSLGKPPPGVRIEVHDAAGQPCPPQRVGELKLWRRNAWIATKDLGYVDEDGYFYHAGRADDVIISAGWTMSAVEIENVLLKHPRVREAAVIGVADPVRGQVVKAFVVAQGAGNDELAAELQAFTRDQLSQHEFPRIVAFVEELPKTPAGKVNRKILRDREAAAPAKAS